MHTRRVDMKKKVLVFFPNCEQGGTERVISLLSPLLSNDFDLHLMTLCKNEKKYNFKYSCFKMIDNPFLYGQGFFNKIRRYLFWYKEIKKYLRDNHIQTIISFGEIPNFFSILIKILSIKKMTVIINIRNSESVFLARAKYGWLIKLSMKLMYDRANEILTNSNGNKIDLIDHIGIKNEIRVIYNPVSKVLDQIIENNRPRRVLHIGRLDAQKAQHYLLEAFSLVSKELKDVELVIIGKGDKEVELIQLARDLNISEKIRFLGWQDNPFYWLQNSDVFVLTSLWEGMPNVAIEALASGCPIVSFDCPSGPNEIINDPGRNGILVDVGDVQSLTLSIIDVLENELLAENLKKNGLIRSKNFNLEVIYHDFKNAINRVAL